ncbi:MAG: transposase [Christensenellaceae bacterium]|nr:transposase [Christensenellaceae bacterium]
MTTPEEFIPESTRIKKEILHPSREYGASAFIMSISQDVRARLHEALNDVDLADSIYVMSILRVLRAESYDKIENEYLSSCISESIPKLNFDKAKITDLLTTIGNNRQQIFEFMNNISKACDNFIFDGSMITAKFDQIELPGDDQSPNQIWEPHLKVIYMFEGSGYPEPILYRCVLDNVPDMIAMLHTMKSLNRESKLTIICNTNFASNSNLEYLEENNISYVAQLNRNNNEISLNESNFTSYFESFIMSKEGPVFVHESVKDKHRLIVFQDMALYYKELNEHEAKIRNANDNENLKENLRQTPDVTPRKSTRVNKSELGIIAIRTTIESDIEEIYGIYRQRLVMEEYFNTLNNTLNRDRMYIQSDMAFEGWCFINHISLILEHRIINTLKKKKLLKKYSLKKVTSLLSKIRKSKISGEWVIHEPGQRVIDLAEKLIFGLKRQTFSSD